MEKNKTKKWKNEKLLPLIGNDDGMWSELFNLISQYSDIAVVVATQSFILSYNTVDRQV